MWSKYELYLLISMILRNISIKAPPIVRLDFLSKYLFILFFKLFFNYSTQIKIHRIITPVPRLGAFFKVS